MRYDYDVLGKITAIKNGNNQAIADTSSLAYLNPLRYRGYVFDDETGLYYLRSRYYDPVTGRFLNADEFIYLFDKDCIFSSNLFCYCNNNYLLSQDEYGNASSRQNNSYSKFNCYAYAFGIKNRNLIPGQLYYERCCHQINVYELPMNKSVVEFLEDIINDFGENKVRVLVGWNSPLKYGEYEIAFRVFYYSQKLIYNKKYKRKVYNYVTLDVHFWKQDPRTGCWWNKHGTSKPQRLGIVNPGYTFSPGWLFYPHGTGGFYKGVFINAYSSNRYYNSETYYLAYKGKFWT